MVCNDARSALLLRARELLEKIDDDALVQAARFLEEISKKNPAGTAAVLPIKKKQE